ncbi:MULTISPECIES: DUF2188 domain-containing protein [Cupriavidus]|jgi:hypothetical protein|uniref:DUF2188 domain-containing protein n=1 Tax=unclassified Cupriavidus TaxID=2640874 RepID=UPI003F8FE69F
MPKNFHIVLNDGFWDLRADGVPRAISRHKTRDEAIRVGRAAAERLKVSLRVEDEQAEAADDVEETEEAETSSPSTFQMDCGIARMAAA